MLRYGARVRTLGASSHQDVLDLCARDPLTNVYPAARVLENGLRNTSTLTLGHHLDRAVDGTVTGSVCWVSGNIVPVEATPAAVEAFAEAIVHRRRQTSSIFGPVGPVLHLWSLLEERWGPARAVRGRQPAMVCRESPLERGIPTDPGVRPTRPGELDLLMPAAAAMYTEEIGVAPYRGGSDAYRQSFARLVAGRRSLVRVDDGEVVFKADIGSVALGVAQVQGVWVHPDRRGEGIAVPAMAAVVEYCRANVAPVVTLYVNDYNTAALATYDRVGFTTASEFATVLV